jgi:adenylate cyclase
VLQRLNKRSVIHLLIVALFVLPALFLSIQPDSHGEFGKYSPYSYSPFLRWTNREFANLELGAADYSIRFGNRAPVNPQIVFLAIDQASTSTYLDSALDAQTINDSRALTLMHTSFPYPREVWALVCDRLIGAGARVVALDLLFPGSSPNDDIWKAALDRYKDKVVVATNFSIDPTNGGTWSLSLPSPSLFPDQDPFDDRLGYVNFWADSDDEIRDAQYRASVDSVNGNKGAENLPKLYSFAANTVKKGGHPELVPDNLVSLTMRFAGPPQLPFKSHSLYEIFDPHSWDKNFHNGDFFRDKIVLVGPAGDFAKDKSDTPYGLMDGSEIHLNAINDLLQGDFLSRASLFLVYTTILLSGLIAFLLAHTLAAVAWRFLAALGVVVGYLVALILAYNGPGWLLPAVAPLGVFCGATATGFIYDFVLNQVEKFRLRTTFERYNSKNVVKYLLENTETYKEMLKGTRRPVTVLFSDIRSFTTIVETTADSHELVNKLNEYLTAMVACVFKYDGSLDKFMGDGIMAVWGNTPFNFGPQEDAVRAVRAALAMGTELRRLNAKWLAEGKTEWHIGISLNHGQAIVGDMGSQQHKEFGVVGDAINLGARLESLTKEYHVEIVLGENVVELIRDHFHLRSVAVVRVKGKTRAVQAFTVLGEKSEPLPPERQKLLSLYEEGFSSFRRREFVRAKELFAQARQIKPDDYLAKIYVESCEAFIKNPPDAAWDGVRVMTEK